MQNSIFNLLLVLLIGLVACNQPSQTPNNTTSTIQDSVEAETTDLVNEEQPMETTLADETTADKSDEKEVEPEQKSTPKSTTDKKSTTTANKSSQPKTSTSKKQTTSSKPQVSSKKSPEPVEPVEEKPTTTTTTSTSTSTPKQPTTTSQKVEPTVDDNDNDKVKEKPAPKFSHDTWDDLLRKHVSSTGKVNYAGLKSDKGLLDGYIKSLQVNPPQSDWSRNKTMAYWINAYNAYTVKLIVDNYPVKSIKDLNGGNPWDVKNITIGGRKYSLNQIEKEILLKKYNEPRVHFAVNCAAKSCPALLNQAWTEGNIQAKYEQQTRKFINNSQFNKLGKKEVELSKIFDWYASDFGDVIGFIKKYTDTEIKDNAKISYIPYDWSLNN